MYRGELKSPGQTNAGDVLVVRVGRTGAAVAVAAAASVTIVMMVAIVGMFECVDCPLGVVVTTLFVDVCVVSVDDCAFAE